MRFALLFTAALLPGLHVSSSALAEELAGRRPNIILVMTDDQGKGDLSCLGNPDLNTPNLDRLHSLSTRFTDFHVSPTCAPTRSAIMSGRHEFRNGVTHTILERERMALSTTTIFQVLQEAGYETGIFGKWHLGDERGVSGRTTADLTKCSSMAREESARRTTAVVPMRPRTSRTDTSTASSDTTPGSCKQKASAQTSSFRRQWAG